MIEVYYWILFIFICLVVLTPIIVFLGDYSTDREHAGKESYLISLSSLLSGLIPIVGSSIISTKGLTNTLMIFLSIVILLNLVLCLLHCKKNIHFLFSLVLVIGISAIPFIGKSEIVAVQTIDFLSVFDLNFPMVLFSFWLPVFIISITTALLIRNKETIKYINPSITTNEKHRNIEFENVLTRKSIENLSSNTIQQYENLVKKINDISSLLTLLRTRQNNHRTNLAEIRGTQSDNVLFQKILNEIQILNSKTSPIKVSEITVTNQTLIRELTHFLTTPLATMETSCKLMKNNDSDKNDYLNRIETAIKICQGILATYYEIFIMTKSKDIFCLSELIRGSFELYKNNNNKELKLELQISDSYESIENYYIISTLLPLLSNAVTAATENSTIEITEGDNKIVISNNYDGDIDLTNFEVEGYSSKPDHKGMGLYTVRHLLARRNLGVLSYYKQNNRIYFNIPIEIYGKEPKTRDFSS